VVVTDADLSQANTLRLRSRAAYLCAVESEAELRRALALSAHTGLPAVVMGEGSNVILPPLLAAVVIRPLLRGIAVLHDAPDCAVIRVGAGENWHEFVAWCLGCGYPGLENLALIPGTVGAAPVQNIGAYGVELERFVLAVEVLMMDGESRRLTCAECAFSYRDSIFKRELADRCVITAVEFMLPRGVPVVVDYPALRQALGQCAPTPALVFDAVCALRRSRLPDPAHEANVGSFFKNPVVSAAEGATLVAQFPDMPQFAAGLQQVKLPAAWLIERCGWRGRRIGALGMHPGHALVMVNYGVASSHDVLQLAGAIADDVAGRFGVALEIEPRVYGGSEVMAADVRV